MFKKIKNTMSQKKQLFVLISYVKKNLIVAAFQICPTSIMALFEIHERFKGHFLNELHVFSKDVFSM